MNNRKQLYLTVFFIATSALMFEVALTRIFSVMLWYHFAYIVISLCLLGIGASGTFISVFNIASDEKRAKTIPLIFSIIYPLLMIFCFLTATKLRIYPLQMLKDKSNIYTLFVIYILLILPFFTSGTVLGYIFSAYNKQIGKLYFYDLVGAGIGATLVALAINLINAPAAIMTAAFIGSLGAVTFNAFLGGRIKTKKIILLPLFCLLVIGVFLKWNWYIFVDPSKELYWSQQDPDVIEYSKWTTIARVDVVWEGNYNPTFGADVAPKYFNTTYRSNFIAQDGVAPTLIFRVDKPVNDMFPFLKSTTQSGAYRINQNPKVCIVGIGGGMDILVALGNEAKNITAVEINPAMVHLCRERYAEKTNNIFNDPKINWVQNEGRHFLASSKDKFDIIQMSGVDTFAALSSGAYVLSENYLYTTDAIKDVYSRLNDNGIYSVSRWFFDPPRETLRLAVICDKALQELNLSDSEKHLFILHGARWATILLKKSPWKPEEIEILKQFCTDNEFAVFYDPYAATINNPFEQYLRADKNGKAKFLDTYRFDVTPVSDNKPFFFQYYRWGEILGIGNMNFKTILGYFITQTPQAFQTLAITIIQLILLSFLIILYPLFKKKSDWKGVKGKLGIIMYFAALGLGFIFIEIILIQDFIIYLGAPLYSLSLILTGLLIFSGIGSMVTSAFSKDAKKKTTIVILILCAVIILFAVFGKTVIDFTLKESMAVKVIITLSMIAPIGFLLGMPFPCGIGILSERHPALIPWAWAINGCFSVIGTMLSILLSSFVGFQAVFVIGAAIYLIGLFGMTKLYLK